MERQWCTYRRCVAWIQSWFFPPVLILQPGPLGSGELHTVQTEPGVRIHMSLRYRQEAPPGIMKLAAILNEYIHERPIQPGGRLAGHSANHG